MTRELNFLDAMNEALREAMATDPSVLVVGENISGTQRAETKGLDAEFGSGRVIDMPISEAAFTGFATGAALSGGRPVVQYQVSSLLFVAFDQLVNQAAKLPLMLGGQRHLPVTYIVMGSGASGGRAGQHSDTPYSYLLHAGIKTAVPSTAADAKGLLTAAIREDDPVALFISPVLARRAGPVPEGTVAAPLGKGVVRREGTDVTVVAVGVTVPLALETAEALDADGISVEVWEPVSLLPLDKAGLLASVEKTGRLVICDDAPRTCGFAAEVASLAADRCFAALKAPVKRVSRADVTTPFGASIEPVTQPNRSQLEATIRAIL